MQTGRTEDQPDLRNLRMLSVDWSEASQEDGSLRALRSNSMQVDLPALQHSTTLNIEDIR